MLFRSIVYENKDKSNKDILMEILKQTPLLQLTKAHTQSAYERIKTIRQPISWSAFESYFQSYTM